jgi:predicted nucleotidyltransferase component of viral defense system
MPRDYLLRHPEFEDLIRIVAGKIGIDPALIEKDGIIHCLYGLQRLGYKFELKGGTSLFKGFKFIRARRRWALLLRRGAMMRQPATRPNRQCCDTIRLCTALRGRCLRFRGVVR